MNADEGRIHGESWWMNMFESLRRLFFKPRIKLVCFDLDNTLYDYRSAETETEVYMAELIAREINAKIMQLRKKKSLVKKRLPSIVEPVVVLRIFNDVKRSHMHHEIDPKRFSRALWFKETLERLEMDVLFGVDVNALFRDAALYEQKYWTYLVPRIRLFPETLKILQSLRGQYKLAALTDSDGAKQIKMDRIRRLGLDIYFDYIITTDDTGVNKPDVKNYTYLLNASGMKARECMMVGDHPDVDLLNAKRLGFTTVWTKELLQNDINYSYVDFSVHDIGQVIDILKMIEK